MLPAAVLARLGPPGAARRDPRTQAVQKRHQVSPARRGQLGSSGCCLPDVLQLVWGADPSPHRSLTEGFSLEVEGGERKDRDVSRGDGWGLLIKALLWQGGARGGGGDLLLTQPEKMRVRSTDKEHGCAYKSREGRNASVNSWLSCPAAAPGNVPAEPAPAPQISKAGEGHGDGGEAVPKKKRGAGWLQLSEFQGV